MPDADLPEGDRSRGDRSIPVRLDADLSAFRTDMDEAARLARGFASALGAAFDGAALRGRALDDVLRDLGLRLARLALDAALRPLAAGIGGSLAAPASAPASAAMALAGPASGGRAPAGASPASLSPAGVPAASAARPLSVTVNVTTPDIEGFRRARGQIAADLARTIDRAARHR